MNFKKRFVSTVPKCMKESVGYDLRTWKNKLCASCCTCIRSQLTNLCVLNYFATSSRYINNYLVSFWSFSMRSAISFPSSSHPFFFWDMSQFWQKTHLRLHIPKKIVPEPFHPWRTDSSPKWGKAEETIAFRPEREKKIIPHLHTVSYQ